MFSRGIARRCGEEVKAGVSLLDPLQRFYLPFRQCQPRGFIKQFLMAAAEEKSPWKIDSSRHARRLTRIDRASSRFLRLATLSVFLLFFSLRFGSLSVDRFVPLSVSSRKTRGITTRARKKCVDRFLSRLPFGAHTVKRAAIGCVIHDICAPDGSACLMKIQ